MDEDVIFDVETVIGVQVALSHSAWDDITRRKHRDMRNLLAEVQMTVTDPDEIRQSISDDRVHLYYRVQGTRSFVCVVTRAKGSRTATVATCYATSRVKPGDLIWQR